MADVRRAWDALEAEQRAFVDGLDGGRPRAHGRATRTRRARRSRSRSGVLLQHVVNHATHHRSEAATMMTIISGSPPDTGINTWALLRTGQTR